VSLTKYIGYSPFSAFSDMLIRALYGISRLWLGITLVPDRAVVLYEYPVKNNILFGKHTATQNVLPCVTACNQPTQHLSVTLYGQVWVEGLNLFIA
jgi:hypothetical protein